MNEGFFSDREVRRFSFKEKITYIFNQLYAILQNEKSISLINKIELPFTDVSVKADPLEYIEIAGENFCYKFPPIMMPDIWYRLKRML